MIKASREFQIFAKPGGARCNLGCRYCYYLEKERLYSKGESHRMPDDILEAYIVQHIKAFPGREINFSWHGGEPMLLGVDYFRKIVAFQKKHRPSNQRITNGMQTNGTLLDEKWCRFLATEGFAVGISLDGPQELHDAYRVTKSGAATQERVMRGYDLLRKHGIAHDILCVVNAENVRYPIRVYRFFKQIGARYISFLPLVEAQPDARDGVSRRTVPAEAFGAFLCAVFDEWLDRDVGRIRVRIFEEAAQSAFGREAALCIFRKYCGDIPVIERNGDIFSCDHFVDPEHRLGNIRETPLVELIEHPVQHAFGKAKWERLPRCCRSCPVLDMCHGGCPKDRFIESPDGEAGLNYLCAAYQRFFIHCRPFVNQLSALWHRRSVDYRMPGGRRPVNTTGSKIGRNDPCPCGSGRKYKKCCLAV